jgi:ribosome recycling factor
VQPGLCYRPAHFGPRRGRTEEPTMINDVLSELQSSIGKAQEACKRDLVKLRAGRASADMVGGIRVDYYGTPTPIPQMANVSVPEPRMITVKPWDKGTLKAIEKAIRESDLGLNPSVDGDIVRIPIPPLTEERRKEFVKIAKKHGEECKVTIRKARHEALDMLAEIKDGGDASEDDVERAKKKVEETVSEGVKGVDVLVAAKEKDILDI